MNNTILCPHCGKPVEITQALKQQIESEIQTNLRRKIEEETRKYLTEKNAVEVADLKKQLSEKNEKVKELQEYELKLREQTRRLAEKEKELELSVARKVDEERKKIEDSAQKRIFEEYRLKNLEKEKVINDLKTALEDARRKASQGSQQLQGEVQELDLEDLLAKTFPTDVLEPVAKGVRGADVRQIVKTSRGNTCGVILWESKRTKAWSDEWIVKLKDDLRAEQANIPVIITSVMPRDVKSDIALKDGVWLCLHDLIIPLAMLLRKNLTDVAYQKAIAAHKGEKSDLLYDYVTSHAFRQQVEVVVEAYNEMREQIDHERASFERIWKAREGQLRRLITGTANMYGSMQGLVGSNSLPQVKGLDFPELEDGNEEEQLKLK